MGKRNSVRKLLNYLKDHIKNYYKNQKKPLCDYDCWHYDSFGGEEGCGQEHGGWGGWPEQIEPGEVCLHPEKRIICEPIQGSMSGFCAALEGVAIKGGPHDNSLIVKLLTNSK